MTDLKFMHKEDMVKKYGYKFNIDPKNFNFDGADWEIFLDNMRGITYVDSHETGYLVQQEYIYDRECYDCGAKTCAEVAYFYEDKTFCEDCPPDGYGE